MESFAHRDGGKKNEVHGVEEPLKGVRFSIEFGAFKLLWQS